MKPEEVARAWFEEVWNEGDESAIDRLFAEDGVAHGLFDASGNEIVGPAGFKPLVRTLRGALHDLRVTIEDVIATEDRAAVRFVARAVHRGDTLGFPATGRTVEFTGMTFMRVKNGKIAEGWNNVDFPAMFEQLKK